MPSRVLFAILIFTNPICCQMVARTDSVRAEEPVAECDGCGSSCRVCPPLELPERPAQVPHPPCECPGCELCQCICAGAVVAADVMLPAPDSGAVIASIVDSPGETRVLFDLPGDSCDTPMACGQANVGRTARILHASLLC